MPTISRTFQLPKGVLGRLDALLPDNEQPGFITNALNAALDDFQRQRFDDFLDNLELDQRYPGLKSEDILRDMRGT